MIGKRILLIICVLIDEYHSSLDEGNRKKQIRMSVFGFYRPLPPFSLPSLGSAAVIALADIHHNASILADYEINVQIVNDGCSNKTVLDPMVKAITVDQSDIIIGEMKDFFIHVFIF